MVVMLGNNNLSYLVLDLETDGLDWQNDPIVAIAFEDLRRMGVQEHWIYPKSIPKDILNYMFDFKKIKVLVGHNVSFDLLFLWKYPELQDWLKAGGRIWDTALAHYMLSGQQEKYPKLRTIAVRDYGCQERTKWIDDLLFNKKDRIKEIKNQLCCLFCDNGYIDNGEQIYRCTCLVAMGDDVTINNLNEELKTLESYQKVSDLPKEKVLEDVQNDVLDTQQIYIRQLEKANELGMTRLIELQMDALLATTEAAFNGIQVLKEKLEENQKLLEQELKEKEDNLQQLVKGYWK